MQGQQLSLALGQRLLRLKKTVCAQPVKPAEDAQICENKGELRRPLREVLCCN
jgi:hypothetical protein